MSLCECGCGQAAPLATKTNARRGAVKGRPVRFIVGHSGRMRPKGVLRYVELPNGCWEWQRSRQPNGYGHLTINNKQILAHRFSYELAKGRIPVGMTLDHLCENPGCVNPSHLEPVTHAENCRRGRAAKLTTKAAQAIRELSETGEDIAPLAARFDVSPRAVRAVLKGEAWS